jgi:hypothetical protein
VKVAHCDIRSKLQQDISGTGIRYRHIHILGDFFVICTKFREYRNLGHLIPISTTRIVVVLL